MTTRTSDFSPITYGDRSGDLLTVGEKLGDLRSPRHTVLGRITGGDRLGDLGSPGLLNIINSRFSSNNRVTPSIDLPPWRFSPYHGGEKLDD